MKWQRCVFQVAYSLSFCVYKEIAFLRDTQLVQNEHLKCTLWFPLKKKKSSGILKNVSFSPTFGFP